MAGARSLPRHCSARRSTFCVCGGVSRAPLRRALRAGGLAALRATVAQVKSARAEMQSDARQAALLAERLSEAARENIEADLTERHVAAMQRVMAEAAKSAAPPGGGEAGDKGAGAPDRGSSEGRGGGTPGS